jgi:hypothetical protein
MSVVSAPLTRHSPLTTEAAIAARILRSSTVPQAFFNWLAEPTSHAECPSECVDGEVRTAINEILIPLLDCASPQERKQTYDCSTWLAAICRYTSDTGRSLELEGAARLLAASLLPLYRCLATGDLQQCLAETRCRMSELLVLVALCEELGTDLIRYLNCRSELDASPTALLKERFHVDLVRAAAIIRQHVDQNDGPQAILSDATCLANANQEPNIALVEWATPDLLWLLAGELLARKTELNLPRAWVDTPVPWTSVADHWNTLASLLSASPTQSNRPPVELTPENSTGDVISFNKSETLANAHETEEGTNGDSCAKADRRKPDHNRPSASDQPGLVGVAHKEEVEIEDSMTPDMSREESQTAVLPPAAQHRSNKAVPESVIPRVMIAEIHTHSDPVLVNVVRRQIATCRAEGRALSLATIVVRPENDAEQSESGDAKGRGLLLWQQKLVNWMAEQPHMTDPYAFLTTDGELLLCLLDLERNETTNLVRHGLVETLTGQRLDDETIGLAKVNVPARYHAGIASTSSPGPSFTPIELIEAAGRCLSAASRHGKASIKSIEVF